MPSPRSKNSTSRLRRRFRAREVSRAAPQSKTMSARLGKNPKGRNPIAKKNGGYPRWIASPTTSNAIFTGLFRFDGSFCGYKRSKGVGHSSTGPSIFKNSNSRDGKPLRLMVGHPPSGKTKSKFSFRLIHPRVGRNRCPNGPCDPRFLEGETYPTHKRERIKSRHKYGANFCPEMATEFYYT